VAPECLVGAIGVGDVDHDRAELSLSKADTRPAAMDVDGVHVHEGLAAIRGAYHLQALSASDELRIHRRERVVELADLGAALHTHHQSRARQLQPELRMERVVVGENRSLARSLFGPCERGEAWNGELAGIAIDPPGRRGRRGQARGRDFF
jgi:hypothetical protein